MIRRRYEYLVGYEYATRDTDDDEVLSTGVGNAVIKARRPIRGSKTVASLTEQLTDKATRDNLEPGDGKYITVVIKNITLLSKA